MPVRGDDAGDAKHPFETSITAHNLARLLPTVDDDRDDDQKPRTSDDETPSEEGVDDTPTHKDGAYARFGDSSSTDTVKQRTVLSSTSFNNRCTGVFEVIDDMIGSLKTVVLALPDDLTALVLLEHIQEHLQDKREKVRFLVLMNELRWTEAITMLDAIPLHDFVSARKVDNVAAITPFKEDLLLVKGSECSGPDTMSDAFLNLFDGPMLTKFCDVGGGGLHDVNMAGLKHDEQGLKLFTMLQKKMRQRQTKLTSGRMLRSIESWISEHIEPAGVHQGTHAPGFLSSPALRSRAGSLMTKDVTSFLLDCVAKPDGPTSARRKSKMEQMPSWVVESLGENVALNVLVNMQRNGIDVSDEDLMLGMDHDAWRELGVDSGILRSKLLQNQRHRLASPHLNNLVSRNASGIDSVEIDLEVLRYKFLKVTLY